MKYPRLTVLCVALALLLLPLFTNRSQAASQEDIMERIRLLEVQIQQLKELKNQKMLASNKEQECLKPLGNSNFCKCIAETLPKEVNFEQYIHFLVAGKESLKYDAMQPEARRAFDVSLEAREKCVDKGWFK